MNIWDKFKNSEPEELAQEQDEKSVVAFVKGKLDEVRQQSQRTSSEGQWLTNSAYCIGLSGVYYDVQSRQFKNLGGPRTTIKRNRLHVNKILPTIQNRLARLCKNPPRWDVKPQTSDQSDKDAARLGTDVIQMVWDKQSLSVKRLDLMNWTQQAGHAYIKVSWDAESGEMLVDPMTGELDYEGDLRLDVVSPFELYPDPLATTLEDCSWVIQAKVRKLDYFKDHYGEKGAEVKEEGAWLLSASYEQRLNSMNTQNPSSGSNQGQMKNAAIEIAYYEKPSRKRPKGRMIVTANGVLLEDKELPAGKIPFVKFDDILVSGKYYSEAVVTHLRPIQDQYNRVIQKRAEWTNKLLAGKYIAARGSGLMQEALNDQSGEVLEYNTVPNAPPPQPMPIPVIPQYAYTEEDRLDAMMNYIAGISEVSRGELPSASIPAVGMQLLTEQDDTRIGIMVERHELSWAKVGQLILIYVQEFYKTPRKMKLAGQGGEYTVKEFTGADIKNNTDVIVVRGSTIPGSKTLRRQEIINVYQMGLLGDPNDPAVRQKVLGSLEYGDLAEVWKDQQLDKQQIKRQFEMMESGIAVTVDELDNHQLALVEYNRLRKTEKYDRFPEEVKVLFDAYKDAHIKAQMLLQNPELGMQDDFTQLAAAKNDLNLQAEQAIDEEQQSIEPPAPEMIQ